MTKAEKELREEIKLLKKRIKKLEDLIGGGSITITTVPYNPPNHVAEPQIDIPGYEIGDPSPNEIICRNTTLPTGRKDDGD